MRNSLRTLSITALFILATAAAWATAPTISSTSPATNKLAVSATSNITVTFNQAMENSTLNANTIKVHGSYRGFYSAAYSVSGNTVTINPDSSFKAGEVITVSVTTGVQNSSFEAMATPRVYSFTVDAPGGYNKFSSPASYTAYGTGSGNHYSTLADLDKDGDIDIATTTSLYNIMSVMLNNGDGTYASAVTYTTLNAFDISAADVDGDGDMDLVVANNSAYGMSVFVNNGSGAFGTRNDFAFTFPQSNAQFVVPVDIDGDGDIDVVANDLTYKYLHIMKNNGSGSFTSTDKEFTTKLGALSAGDLDKDGDMDILAACATVDSVEQMNNDGAGNLTMATRFYWTSTSGPSATLIADINSTVGDKQDLVWLNSGSDLLSYFKDGSGIPLFTADNVTVGDYPVQVNAVDVDTDSDLDLVVANYNDATFSVLTNTGSGTGTFTRTNYSLPTYPDDLSTADIDGDGDMDIVTINSDAKVTVFKNYNGGHVSSISPANAALDQSASSDIVITFDENINSATLTASTVKIQGSVSGRHTWTLSSYNSSTYTATINPAADFVPGEAVNVTVTTGVQNGNAVALERGRSSQFVIAAGDGAVLSAKTDYAAGTQPKSVVLANLNADSYPDLVVVNYGSDNLSVRLNNGDGTYGVETLLSTGSNPSAVAAGDVDGDGDIDLVVAVTGANQLARFPNSGFGTFGPAATFSTSGSPVAISLSDIDGDGDLDALYTAGQAYRQKNDGTGSFSDEWGSSSSNVAVTAADVDNDGDLDLIGTYDNSTISTFFVYKNTGTGDWSNLFTGIANYSTGYYPTGMAVRDFNGDGYADIVTTNLALGNGSISYFQNNQDGTFAAKVDYTVASGAQPRGVAALDIDGDGDLDLSIANAAGDAAKIFINNGSGVFSDGGSYTTGATPYAIAAADVDGDGAMDVATANNGGSSLSVLLNEIVTATVTTSAASSITTTGATLNGTVNANNLTTAVKFAYKLSSSGTFADTIVATPTGFAGGAVTSVSAALTGLAQYTAYDFKLVGINGGGTSTGSVLSFTTLENAIAVASMSPAMNALDVDTAANITVTFNVAVNADSLNARNVMVSGSFSGQIAGAISYDGPSKTMTFNPTGYFRAGEIVSVTLKSGIASASALTFVTARTYSFSAAATGTGPGFFNVTTVSNFFSNSESEFMSADVNKDGLVDLIAYQFGSPMTVSLNSGGTFASPVSYPYRPDNNAGAGNVAYGDIDNDGNGDLIVLQSNGSSYQYIVMLKNDGNGAFALYDSIATPTPWMYGMTVADYNNDGRLDIAYPYNGSIYVKYNNGAKSSAGGWTASNTLTAADVSYLTSADIDNDGDIDLIGMGNSSLKVLKNNGNSTFAAAVAYTGDADKMEARDLNNDHYLDMIYFGGGPKTFRVRLNNGDGTFGSEVTTTIGIQPAKMVTGDLDGDGDIDVAFCYQNESYVAAAYNNGSGVFTQQALFGANLAGLTLMDYDHDGDLDILGKNWNGNVDLNILVNTAPAAPSTNVSNVAFANDYGEQVTLNWTNGNGVGRIVVMKQGSAVTWTPADDVSYTANAAFAAGTDLGGGSYVVYNGASAGTGSAVITGLSVNTTYHVAAYEYNGIGSLVKYNTVSPGTASQTTNTVAGFPFDSTAGYALRYTSGSSRWDYANSNFSLGNAFTIEAWVKPATVGSAMGVITFGTGGTGGVMEIGVDASGHVTGKVYDEDAESDITITGTATVSANQWYHVVLSGADGAPLKLYVNGTLDASSGGNIGTVTTVTGTFYTGGDWNNSNFRGEIDEVRRWGTVRTQAEIRAYMHRTLSGIPANLQNYWQFTEGSNDPTEDVVGNNPIYPDGGSLDWVTSTAPIGGGVNASASVAANNAGPHTVGNISLSMANAFDNPVEVSVTEVTEAPSSYPIGFGSSTGGKYFVIDLFGDPGTFNTSITLTYGPNVITPAQQTDPSTLRLFKRPSNSTGAWTDVGGAIAANSTTGEVTWSGITSFSQFMSVDMSAELPPTFTFTKADYADWTLAGNQDQLSENVIITRADNEGIFNIAQQPSYSGGGPAGTEWAAGKISDGVENLTFDTWHSTTRDAWGDKPNMVGHDMVLHLIDEDLYFDIKFTSWTSNDNGGGYSYVRSLKDLELINSGSSNMTATSVTLSGQIHSKTTTATAYLLYGTVSGAYTDSVAITPGIIPADTLRSISTTLTGLTSWTKYYYAFAASNASIYGRSGEGSVVPHPVTIWSKNNGTVTKSKADNADFTLAANQDRITGDIWLTRGDTRGLFNIRTEGAYDNNDHTSPQGTEWGLGTTDDIAAITFSTWYNVHNGNPPSVVGQNQVVHIYNEAKKVDVYFDLKFTAWTQNGGGGGFSYDRAITPLVAWATNADGVTGTAATLHGQAYSHASSATAYLLYGTASGVYTDSVIASPVSINSATLSDVSASVSSLTPGVTYYYTVAVTQTGGTYLRGYEGSLVTMSSLAGNALQFDGTDDHVRIADDNALDLTTSYTLEAWIKPETFSSMAGIISKYHSGGANGYFIRLSNNAPYTGIRFDEQETASGILTADTWYHIAAVNDNGTRTLYVNGVAVSISGDSYTTESNDNHVAIGSDFNGRYFDGAIDEVRIWNVARTPQQIRNAMYTSFTSPQSGLVGYWQFNASSGTEAQNHGSLSTSGLLQNFNNTASSGWVTSGAEIGPLAAGISETVSNLGATTATVSGSVFSSSASATARFLYGTSSGTYSDSMLVTPASIAADSATAVSAVLTSLAPGVQYYIRLAAQNGTIYKRSAEISVVTYSASPGNALRFDGTNDYVAVNTGNASVSAPYTIEAWVRPNTTDGGSIFSTRQPSDNGMDLKLTNDGRLYADIGNGGGWIQTGIGASMPYTAGVWVHVAIVVTNAGYTMYSNGTQIGSGSFGDEAPLLYNGSHQMVFGAVGTGELFNGSIDEIRVWNTARTQQQIQDNLHLPFTGPQSGLVAYFQFNESAGTVAHNLAGSGDGTLNGFNFNGTSGWFTSEAPLPVELSSFTAEAKRLNAELKWTTATEKNNYGFEVERSMVVDAPNTKAKEKVVSSERSWSKVAFVEGNGTSNAPKEYLYSDKAGKHGKYVYRLKIIDRDGTFGYSPEVEVTVGSVPKVFALEQNYPNPFNPSTMIDFTLEQTGLTTLKIYDIVGREVAVLVNNELLEAGIYHQKVFNASHLASGIYFARLTSNGKVQMKKMMLVK